MKTKRKLLTSRCKCKEKNDVRIEMYHRGNDFQSRAVHCHGATYIRIYIYISLEIDKVEMVSATVTHWTRKWKATCGALALFVTIPRLRGVPHTNYNALTALLQELSSAHRRTFSTLIYSVVDGGFFFFQFSPSPPQAGLDHNEYSSREWGIF